jgi:exoribonuclease R
MTNNIFETNYTTYIEPLYGPTRNEPRDIELTADIVEPHDYSIPLDERYDFTEYDVYSIDPEGCEDADDAFSVYTDRDLLYLAIHIADPTEFIRLHSDLWVSIVQRTTTKYLSNRKPIHMIPEQVLKMVSLQGENEMKHTISVITEINKDTYKPQGEVKLVFGKVLVKRAHAFSYKQASVHDLDALKIGLQISEQLQIQRGKKTKGVKLNELTPAHVCYENGNAYLRIRDICKLLCGRVLKKHFKLWNIQDVSGERVARRNSE